MMHASIYTACKQDGIVLSADAGLRANTRDADARARLTI
jgi:hypothetical protein